MPTKEINRSATVRFLYAKEQYHVDKESDAYTHDVEHDYNRDSGLFKIKTTVGPNTKYVSIDYVISNDRMIINEPVPDTYCGPERLLDDDRKKLVADYLIPVIEYVAEKRNLKPDYFIWLNNLKRTEGHTSHSDWLALTEHIQKHTVDNHLNHLLKGTRLSKGHIE